MTVSPLLAPVNSKALNGLTSLTAPGLPLRPSPIAGPTLEINSGTDLLKKDPVASGRPLRSPDSNVKLEGSKELIVPGSLPCNCEEIVWLMDSQ